MVRGGVVVRLVVGPGRRRWNVGRRKVVALVLLLWVFFWRRLLFVLKMFFWTRSRAQCVCFVLFCVGPFLAFCFDNAPSRLLVALFVTWRGRGRNSGLIQQPGAMGVQWQQQQQHGQQVTN